MSCRQCLDVSQLKIRRLLFDCAFHYIATSPCKFVVTWEESYQSSGSQRGDCRCYPELDSPHQRQHPLPCLGCHTLHCSHCQPLSSHTCSPQAPCQCTLSMHPVDHPVDAPCQCTVSMHPVNAHRAVIKQKVKQHQSKQGWHEPHLCMHTVGSV